MCFPPLEASPPPSSVVPTSAYAIQRRIAYSVVKNVFHDAPKMLDNKIHGSRESGVGGWEKAEAGNEMTGIAPPGKLAIT
jgi:hypothetical protein